MCVRTRMRSYAPCVYVRVCVSAPDQTLIAIFSSMGSWGSNPAAWGDRVQILGGEGKKRGETGSQR